MVFKGQLFLSLKPFVGECRYQAHFMRGIGDARQSIVAKKEGRNLQNE